MRQSARYGTLAVLAAAVSLGFQSPAHAASENRQLPQFAQIVTNGAFTLVVEAGKAQSVHLQSDPDYLARIKTSVEGTVLLVETVGQGTIEADIRVSIAIPVFEGLTILGSTGAEITNVQGGPVSLTIDGAGDIAIDGNCATLQVSIGGSGAIFAQDLHCQDVVVAIGGAGEVEAHASHSLKAAIAGSGDIAVYGHPPRVEQTITGAGEVYLD
ncbi:MAG: GIN domain-containing protein [Alphaproteobacteria bacterium]